MLERGGGAAAGQQVVAQVCLTAVEYLGYSRSETELSVMRALKQALDPKEILNPGKVLA